MDEIMLRVDNVSKIYQLGEFGRATLRDELQRKMAKLRGQEDPTRQIGAVNHQPGELFTALDGVAFDVRKGERVGIIGHNGAGKSTLLKLISRVTAPSSGRIQMNGRVASMLEVGTGFHSELTGRENIYMNGAILGMTKKEIDAKVEDIIEFSEMRQFIDTPAKRYSSGMYIKLAFSVSAHLDAEIMIMDEVLAVGDIAFQKKCLDKMNDVSKSLGRTILYVSHNMNTIRQLCDRVIVMDHGKIVFDGDVEEGISVYSADAFREDGLPVHYDYPDVRRALPGAADDVRLLCFEFTDKKSPVYAEGEKLHFALKWRTEKAVSDAGLRIVISKKDGTAIGMTLCENCISSQGMSVKTQYYELDTSDFTQGVYVLTLYVCHKNLSNTLVDLDGVPEMKILFKVISELTEEYTWENQSWGALRLKTLRLTGEALNG